MNLAFVYVLHLICTAAHLSQVVSSGDPPAFIIDVALNSSDFETTEYVVYDLESEDFSNTYSLIFSMECPNNTFSIRADTGEVVIVQPVEFTMQDLEPVCVRTSLGYVTTLRTYSCFVVIENLGQSYGVLVIINVVPNFPSTQIIFQQECYSVEIMEGVQRVAIFGGNGIQAITLPVSNLLTPEYRILNGHGSFEVSEQIVQCKTFIQIYTTQALDRETQDYYEITLEAYTSQTSANTTIKVYVLDRNDNEPGFLSAPDSVTVGANSLHIGETVTQFQASDDDSGFNAKLTYSFTFLSSLFGINPFTGSLFRYSSQRLTETTRTVRVTDVGSPQHEILTNISIFIDVEDQQHPSIHVLGLLVASESDLINHVVSTLHVTSSGGVLIHLESRQCNCFKLSNLIKISDGEYSIELQINEALDFEFFPDGINVTITATDEDHPQYMSTEEVRVAITDENEPPIFLEDEYEVKVLEGTPIGSEIFRIVASDPDSGSNGALEYTFANDPPSSPFSVNSSNGIVYTVSTVDYETLTSVEMTVTVEDGAGERDQTVLVITILDRNDQQPSFSTSEQTVVILETILANESIFHFAASDDDSQCNAAISYSIIHAEPLVFRVDSVSGLLFPLGDDAIDYEQFQSATVIVRASDLGVDTSEFADTTLHIDITDVNDERPQMSKIECPCFIQEASTQHCQLLSAYDADSINLLFSIQSGNEQNMFFMNTETGAVSTNNQLIYEDDIVYKLEIIASDGEFESDPETLNIIIVDIRNDVPQYPDPYNFVTPVDTPIGSLIGEVSTQNGNTGYNALTNYQIITSDVTDVLRLDSLNGNLYLKSAPQSDNQYDFFVTATDILNSGNVATATVTVTFSGQHNNAPYFRTPIDHIDVASNSQVGTELYEIIAVDDDDGAVLTYSLVTSSDFFEVTSDGKLSLTQSLSNQIGSEFTLSILVSDGGTPLLYDRLELRITVYGSSIDIGGESFQHNPGVTVRHHFANILEGTSLSLPVSSLPSEEGGSVIQYTILQQGEFFNAFRLQDQNEVVSNVGYQDVFDRTQHEAVFLTLRAQYGSNFYYLSLTITIDDINDNGPEFEQDEYSVEIYRSTPQGGYIFEFEAHDPDIGSNAVISYSIDPSSDNFNIVPGTGFLEVISDLTEPLYFLTIVASDSESSELPSATCTLHITVLETENIEPSILPDTYEVSETASIGSLVGSLTVTDEDSGMHGSNTICFVSGDVENQFRLNQNGDIFINSQLDYETKQSYTLTVLAYDSSPNPESSTSQITIHVEDENEEPIFLPKKYFATIVENNPAITPVLTVTAFDDDSGTSGEIEYSVLNVTTFFSIHPTTGLVSTRSTLNRESMTQHSFTVAAKDAGGLTATANVLVSVLDVNDNDPVFHSPNFVTMCEDTSLGTQVIQLQAMDKDGGGNGSVKFEIASGNEAHVFSLDPFSGSLTLSKLLDFETDPQSMELLFRVSDLGIPTRTSSVTHRITFSLENVNDNFPIFSSSLYTCTIREGTNSFLPTCQVSATDADESDSIAFDIISGNIGSAFRINAQTGFIVRQNVIDRESISRYVLKIRATNPGSSSLSSYALVLVEVEDENDDLPKFDPIIATHIPKSSTRLSQFYFSELLPHNTLLFFAHAVDSDIGENGDISYNIIRDNTDLFHVDSNTSAVILTGSFDFETTQSHELIIEATNPSGTATSHLYTINVLNENENLFPPVFSPDSPPAVTISRPASFGTHLVGVNATDTDPGPGGDIRYYITGGSGYGYFTIDQFHGEISVLYTLTGIRDSEVTLEVLARDCGCPPLSSTYTLLVILEPDSGTKPFFSSAQFTIFAPETFSSQIFTNILALVNDRPASNVTYSIVSGNEESKFAINPSTGAISTTGILNREAKLIYTLFVSASIGLMHTSAALVAITVADSNDNTPSFHINHDVTIFNNHPTGRENAFMRVFAIDADAGLNSRLEYSITSDTSSIFAIDSTNGDLYLTESLSTTATSSYELSVRVTDMATLPLTESTTFTVTTIPPASINNNDAPSFASSSTVEEVPEDTTPDFLVYTAQASDSSGQHLVYQITEPLANFAIMPNSGKVYLIKSLDREERMQYTIRIKASDGSLSSSTFLLNVVVTDINDNRPVFTSEEFVFTVAEHSESDTLVGHLTADDMDDSNTVTYSLVDSQHPSSIAMFSVTGDGELRVAGTIDREAQPTHYLTVSAEDDGNPTLTSYARVKVMVTDINDHMPVFIKPLKNVSISESITVGTPIFNVSVFDPDTGVRGSFSYSLSPNTTPFAINESTGELYVASELDAEEKTSYTLVISVADQVSPSMIATTTLQVNIVDELDSLPALTNPGTITLPEGTPPYTIVTCVADRSGLRSIHYDIISGNDANSFFIEPLTGIVRTAVTLDRERAISYSLTVGGTFEKNYESSRTFTIIVTDINDEVPTFSGRFLEYSLLEDSPVSASLLRLNFTDKDEGTNTQIGEFYIPDPKAASLFEVDTSGNLKLLQSLDREGKFDTIDFQLYIFDSGNPPLHDVAHLSITVLDVNDNPPYFLQSSYSFIVSLPVIVDSILFSVQAKDQDIESTIRYEITGGNGTDKFSINAITGGISISDNYKLQLYYRLIVTATDEGVQETSVSVNIRTKECGFNNLLFHPRVISESVAENTPNGTVIFQPNLLTFDAPASVRYSFSTADSLFQINNITGVVSIKSSLDREQQDTHQFSVQARDIISDAVRIAQADIEIVVMDANDNAPMFQGAPYEVYITDDFEGELIRVRAVDMDEGNNGVVSYHLESGCSGFYEIEENTGQISLLSALETMSLVEACDTLNIRASDKGIPQMFATTTVTVNIVDSNAPLFTSNGGYSAEVNESASRDTVVVTVRAEATSTSPQIRYNIASTQSLSLPFSIGFMSGDVTVNGIGLDYESNTSYRLLLEAIDLSTSLEGRATLDIQVLDVNDNRPEFTMALYQSSVTENSNVGISVEEVSARDLDSGENSDVTYFLDPNDIVTTFFNIHEDTGLISTSAAIDREQNDFFRFSVLAKDAGSPSLTGTTIVQIEILDVNDNAPTFLESPYRGTVSEDDAAGTSLLFVAATDLDHDNIEYGIVTTPGSSNFEISSGGLITLTTAASNLNEFQYQLNISAYDGEFYGYAEVLIETEDANNHAPMFNATIYSAHIIENADIGEVVTQVFATDDDRGGNAELTFSVSSDLFAIDPETGVISVSAELDRESNPNGVILIVIARDGGGRTGTAEVDIELGDINDNPPTFTSLMYRFDVQEGASIGTTVSTSVRATDPDAGSNGSIRYSIPETDDPQQFPFVIDELSGAITTRLPVDPNFQDEYSFTVNAVDEGTPPMSADPSVTVTVQVIADGEVPPRFENSSYTVSITENNQYGQVLLMPQLVVSEPCDVVTFSLLSDNDMFHIEHEDDNLYATIIVTDILDREESPTHTITIQADCLPITSSEVLSDFAIVFVNVLDENEPPAFSNVLLRGTIAENIALQSILQLEGHINAVEASDEDSGENGIIRYSIEEDEVPFEVSPTSGIITVSGELDRELRDEYRFNIIVTDLGDPPLTGSVRILVTIEDVNDSPPVFEQTVYHGQVAEGAAIGTSVITITASDADLNEFGVNFYSVSGSDVFSIVNTTGELQVIGNIDRETTSTYTLQISATDGVNAASTTVTINVTDINDNPPVFNDTQYQIEVSENYATGIHILQVFATDADLGVNAEISYDILEDQQLLHINSSTGEVSFSQTPDYEMSSQGHFEFRVIAMNPNDENMRAVATLIIDLIDLNDNAPFFSDLDSPVQVSENRESGVTVVRIMAEDFDSGINARVQYALREEDLDYFTIDSQTGIIQTAVTFDREINSNFELTITATDFGMPPLSSNTTILVLISDENDNPPVFSQDNYTVVVLEGVAIGRVIRNIRADDADQGSNAEIMYRLTGDNSAHFLPVMQEDGGFDLQVAQMLNRENIAMYDLSITAFDGGFPFLEATVPLAIVVQDENDNPPEFDPPFYSVVFPEDIAVGTEITVVHANDPDSAEITQLTYSIFNAGSNTQFEIDVFNGRILLVQPLDYEEDQIHIFTAQAEDQVHPPVTASVIVTVTNVNDNAPEFIMSNYTTSVTENAPGRELFDFTVIDRDVDSDPSIVSFRIESGNIDGIFFIDPTSGALAVEENFDAEMLTTHEYLLTVTASDNEEPPLAGTAYVTVHVVDINDNPPVGEDQVIHLLLYNGQLALRSLGKLLIRDPDRVNDHQFDVSGDDSIFSISFEGGIDIVQYPPPPGVYSFTVHVTDGNVGSATTHVDINVANITDTHLANSFTMQVHADSAESFLDKHLQHFISTIESIVTDKANIRSSKAYVFNITDSRTGVDISVVVQAGDGELIHPTLVQHLIHINRDDIEANLGLTITTEHVDPCGDESACPRGTMCTISHQYSSSSAVLGSAAASLVGINKVETITCSSQTPECTISCPEPSYCAQENGQRVCINDCSSNPCENNGKCQEQNPGYYCSCPSGFNGRNCELTASYFEKGSYAILPAVSTSTNGTIVLEFTAGSGEEGLLYYSSRFDDAQSDFLALEIIGDHLSVIASYGDNTMRVSLRLSGDDWYRAEVDYSSTVRIATKIK